MAWTEASIGSPLGHETKGDGNPTSLSSSPSSPRPPAPTTTPGPGASTSHSGAGSWAVMVALAAVWAGLVVQHQGDFHDSSSFGLHSRCANLYARTPLNNISAWSNTMLNETGCLEAYAQCPEMQPLCRRPDTLAQELLSGNNFKALVLNSPTNYITPFHTAATDTVACLVTGRKKWYFWNRHLAQYYDDEMLHRGVMYTHRHFHTRHVYEQRPGDCLFFRPFTFHKVVTYGESTLVTSHHCSSLWFALRQALFHRVLTL